MKHAQSLGSGNWKTDVAYWIAVLSTRSSPEELSDSDLRSSGMFRALSDQSCRGTCMCLDQQGVPLQRAWCFMEAFCSAEANMNGRGRHNGITFCSPSGSVKNNTMLKT